MLKRLIDLFRPTPVTVPDISIWHRAPETGLFKPYADADGRPIHSQHVMQRLRNGAWQYREMTTDEYAEKLFDQGAIM